MTFTKPSASTEPLKNSIFAMAALAARDRQVHPDLVIDATIGSLYEDNGRLAAYDSVFDHFDQIDHVAKAKYASGSSGNPDYREAVYAWVRQGTDLHLPHSVVATPGGTGALSAVMANALEPGMSVLLPAICWGNYFLMASQLGLKSAVYEVFDEQDHFNLASLADAIARLQQEQDRILIVLNDPCQNPTGYSLLDEEWEAVIQLLNQASRKTPVILINDIAYLDYAAHLETCRNYMNHFNEISDQVMIITAFSASKTLTSYGLRCGAAIVQAQNQEEVDTFARCLSQTARAVWSSIPNAAMDNFVWVTRQNREAFLAEKQIHVDLLQKRASIFVQEARACGLDIYPFKEGFFLSLRLPQAMVQPAHQALIQNHIYTVPVHAGIRVAICSIPTDRITGLAPRIQGILQPLKAD